MAPPLPLRERLKTLTAPFHSAIESTSKASEILAGTLDREGYCALLARFYGFHLPVEQRLMQHEQALAAWGLEISQRLRAPKLAQDLAMCGAHVDSLPSCDALPLLERLDEAVGVLYVLEGSTMGGMMIAPKVREHLSGAGVAYFDAYGARTREMWMGFVGALERWEQSGTLNPEAVILGATSAYLSLERWLRA